MPVIECDEHKISRHKYVADLLTNHVLFVKEIFNVAPW